MEKGSAFDRIQKMLEEMPENIFILEDQIDIDLQNDYFKEAKTIKKEAINEKEVFEESKLLFSEKKTLEEKRILLLKLATLNNVEAFRILEHFLDDSEAELRGWAILAMQQSRMLLEASLSEDAPIFISTGLGGKKGQLRYFVVFVSKQMTNFNEFQCGMLESEMQFTLKKNGGEIEKMHYGECYAAITLLLPLRLSIKEVLVETLKEINQYGNFVSDSFLVTNIKILDNQEILKGIDENGEKCK